MCGYKYNYMASDNAFVQQFGLYNTREMAWKRLCFLLGRVNPIHTGFSQSYKSEYGVLWIHKLEFGDNITNLNQPLSLSAKQS